MQKLGACWSEGIKAYGNSLISVLITIRKTIDAQGEDFDAGPIETFEVRCWASVLKDIGNHARLK